MSERVLRSSCRPCRARSARGHAAAPGGARGHLRRARTSPTSPAAAGRAGRRAARRHGFADRATAGSAGAPVAGPDRRGGRAIAARPGLRGSRCCSTSGSATSRLSGRTPTLSAGELQRLRLATQLRSNLFGVVYVLDEPSAGLHPADAEALLAVLDRLKAAGNSLFVVEHDLDVSAAPTGSSTSGPGAGERGGRSSTAARSAGLAAVPASATRPLPLRRAARAGRQRRPAARRQPAGWLELRGRHPEQPARPRRRASRSASSPRSPASPGRASRPWSARCWPSRRGAPRHAPRRSRRPPTRRASRPAASRTTARSVGRATGLEAVDRLVRGGPEADRPHAAVEPRHLHRPLRRASASCSPATDDGQGPGLRRRPVLLQRRRRPVRDLPGRGVRHGRAAVPARASTPRARPATARATTPETLEVDVPRQARSPTCWA